MNMKLKLLGYMPIIVSACVAEAFAQDMKQENPLPVSIEPLVYGIIYKNQDPELEGVKHATSLGFVLKGLRGTGIGGLGKVWKRRGKVMDPEGSMTFGFSSDKKMRESGLEYLGKTSGKSYEFNFQDDQGRKIGDLFELSEILSYDGKEIAYVARFDGIPFKDSKWLHLTGSFSLNYKDAIKKTESKKLAVQEGEGLDFGVFKLTIDKIEQYEKKSGILLDKDTNFHIHFKIEPNDQKITGLSLSLKGNFGDRQNHEQVPMNLSESENNIFKHSFYHLPDSMEVSASYIEGWEMKIPVDLKFNLLSGEEK